VCGRCAVFKCQAGASSRFFEVHRSCWHWYDHTVRRLEVLDEIGVIWDSPWYGSSDEVKADFPHVLEPDKHVQIEEGFHVTSGRVGAVPEGVGVPALIFVPHRCPLTNCSSTWAIHAVFRQGNSVGPFPVMSRICSSKCGQGNVHSRGLMVRKKLG